MDEDTRYIITLGMGDSLQVFNGWHCGFTWVKWGGADEGRMYPSYSNALHNLMAYCQRYGHYQGCAPGAATDMLMWTKWDIRIQRVTRTNTWTLE